MLRALIVCVDYHDLLARTLPKNYKHFDELLVITSTADRRTPAAALAYGATDVYATDAFTRDGATFNKGRAIEEALDVLGRRGWLCHLDADIVLPPEAGRIMRDQIPGSLYLARRRMCLDAATWKGTGSAAVWAQYPLAAEADAVAGFFQLWHADDPILAGRRPWYPTHWAHAGGSDTDFCELWPPDRRAYLGFEVLHLGEPCRNWWGRTTDHLDGTTPEHAQDRAERMRQMYRDRREHGYNLEKIRPGGHP